MMIKFSVIVHLFPTVFLSPISHSPAFALYGIWQFAQFVVQENKPILCLHIQEPRRGKERGSYWSVMEVLGPCVG